MELTDQLNHVVGREGKFVVNGIPNFLVKRNHMYVSHLRSHLNQTPKMQITKSSKLGSH